MPPAEFRAAMARMAAAVKVVTSDGPAGRTGFTATAVCSVTDTPPRLLVCLNASSSSHPFVTGNGRFCVNVLPAGAEEVAQGFGGGLPREDRFGRGSWLRSAQGQWMLEDALAAFDCVITQTLVSGSHSIFLADVVASHARTGGGPMIYADRDFTTIAPKVAQDA